MTGRRVPVSEGPLEPEEAALDTLETQPARVDPGRPMVAEIIDARHPTRLGCVLAAWEDAAGQPVERWLPTLHGLAVRPGDRVLLVQPGNLAEPVVTGVIDGFTPRPEPARSVRAALALQPDETIQIEATNGVPLIEVRQGETGPVVRLLAPDVDLELPGALKVRADRISLGARHGDVRIEASDDVIVRGEVVKLN